MAGTVYINNDILQERVDLFLANLATYRKAFATDEKKRADYFNNIHDIDKLITIFRTVFARPREGNLVDSINLVQKNYIEQAYRLPFTSEGRNKIIELCGHKLEHRTGNSIDRAKDRLNSITIVHRCAVAAQVMAVEMGRIEHKPMAEGHISKFMDRLKVFLDKEKGNNVVSFPKKDGPGPRKG